MDVKRWERVKVLFEAAVERDEPERSLFLHQACPDDAELRHEVESLLSGQKKLGDFLREPAARIPLAAPDGDHPPSTFAPREILSGRYEVLRFIGRGGMGEVYEVRDRERKVRVALKTIRPEIASDPKTLARFNQEIELSLRVTHRNVCRVYHMERHRPAESSGKPEVVFLTMELLEGETLANRLQRQGKMSSQEARPLIRQMAEGLAAAHKEGVVHCDFKPGNVMLVGEKPLGVDSVQLTQSIDLTAGLAPDQANSAVEGSLTGATRRAVITDFGLAQALRPTVTRESIQESLDTGGDLAVGQLVGTLPYMAPEQLEGHAATPASDVYALGLVIYEMLTGRQPFSGPTPLAVAYKRVSEAPPSPRALAPDLDAGLVSIIVRCLEREPGSRYASAGEVVAALVESGDQALGLRRLRRPLTWVAIVTCVLLLAVVLAAFGPTLREKLGGYLFRPGIPERKNLVVLPFRAVDHIPEEEARCDGLTETVTAKLAQVPAVEVAPAESVREHHVDTFARARTQLGANLVLYASWTQMGSAIVINLALVQVDRKQEKQLRADTLQGIGNDVADLQDRVVLSALRMLQVEVSPADQKGLTAHGTDAPLAYDYYVQGTGYLQQYEKPQSLDAAIALFQHSINEDPRYAQAYAALAQADWYKYTATKDTQWADRAKAAVTSADNLGRGLPEVLVATGDLKMRTGDYAGAAADLEQAVKLDPKNVDAYPRLGRAYNVLGRTEQAEWAFRQGILLSPRRWQCYDSLGEFLYRHARYKEALQSWRKMIDLSPDNVFGYMNVGVYYYQVGDFSHAADYFQRGLELDPDNPDLYADAGTVNFFLRRYSEAARLTEKAVDLQPIDFVNRGNLADAYREIPGKQQKALQNYRQAIALAEDSLRVNPNDAATLSSLALYYARTGNLPASESTLARALKLDQDDVDVLQIACLVGLEAGDKHAALEWLEKAVRAGYPRGQLLANPELDRLRAEPQFASLAREAKSYE